MFMYMIYFCNFLIALMSIFQYFESDVLSQNCYDVDYHNRLVNIPGYT